MPRSRAVPLSICRGNSMRRKVSVFWIFWWSGCAVTVTALECGFPGSPAHGRPLPLKESYAPGEAVSFACRHGYSLQGSMQRVCLPNGTWAGPLPLCDRSLSTVDHQASSRQTLSHYPADMAIDGDPRTCTYTDKLRPRWIRVDMRQNYRVKAVALSVPPNAYTEDPAHLTIYAISVRDSTTASYHKCASFNGIFATTTLRLSCSGGEVEGRYIHVEDNRGRIDYFSLCEIQIYVDKGTYECGEAERPAHSYYSVRTESGAVDYRCVHGYRLLGTPTRHCLPDGQWSSSQPVCQEITCPPVDGIEHGHLQYVGRRKEPLTLGTLINVSCDYGYRASGNPLRCEENGQWTGGNLACKPIDCGVPFVRFDSEQYVLPNGTTYGSVALQRCGSMETTLVCREDGTWSPSDLDCEEQNILSKLGLIEEQNDVPLGIVVGVAVVVLILLLLVVLVLLMKRRRAVFRRNSADSLPSKGTGSTAANPSPQPYENDAFYATIPVDDADKGFVSSTVLLNNRRRSGSTDEDSTRGCCIYEEVDAGQKKKSDPRRPPPGESNQPPPVYAQVDLDRKRHSRMVRSKMTGGRFEPVDPPPWEEEGGTYRAEEAPTFDDDVDLEPIKLRELPPIPDDSGSDVTYASLCVPLDPPPGTVVKDNELYS